MDLSAHEIHENDMLQCKVSLGKVLNCGHGVLTRNGDSFGGHLPSMTLIQVAKLLMK